MVFSTIRCLFQPWNTTLHLVTLIVSLWVGVKSEQSWGYPLLLGGSLTYLTLMLMYDLLYYYFAIPVIDPSETLAHGYNYSLLLDDEGSALGKGLDYGFNYYHGDFNKSREQAQQDKFQHAYEALGLQPGMKVLDCGCGCGDWLDWLRTQGVEGVGINITSGQAEVVRSRGLEVHHTDWKKIASTPALQQALYEQFDAVTFWDTAEHYVPAQHRKNRRAQDQIYQQMFQLAQACLKADSPSRRVWVSCLHLQPRKSSSLKHNWVNYLLDKFHSGSYPTFLDRQLTYNAESQGLRLLQEENLTEDYFMTSVLEPTHFGRHKFKLTPSRLWTLGWNTLMDPNWLPRLIWFQTEAWMDQFDHENLPDSVMQLLWLTYQA